MSGTAFYPAEFQWNSGTGTLERMYSDTGGSLSPCAFAGIEFIIAVSPQQYRFLPEKQFAETADRPRFPAEVQPDQLGETGPAVPEFPLRHPGTSVSGFSGILSIVHVTVLLSFPEVPRPAEESSAEAARALRSILLAPPQFETMS